MPHKRSQKGKTKQEQRQELYNQTKEARSIIEESSFNDMQKHETVARTTTSEVLTEMSRRFTAVIVGAVPEVEDGLILRNDYGQGIFQV
jgi:hypothetical protein